MAKKSPTAAAAKWAKNTGASAQAYKDGVARQTVSPTEKAAQAADRYAAAVQESVANGTYQAGLRSVSLADWKEAATEKGAARLASGAAMAQPKMQKFLSQWMPYMDSVTESLPERGDFETNKARAIAVMDAAKAAKGTMGGK